MAVFHVGEIAVLQNIVGVMSYVNGKEVEVISGLGMRRVRDLDGNTGFKVTYGVDYQGLRVAVRDSQLRKKKPDPDEIKDDALKIVSWDSCAWQPTVAA